MLRVLERAGKDQKHAIPYGIWYGQANSGFVCVGPDRNTAALAVESIRRWWALAGKDAYPGATRLLVTCDVGGSNGYRNGHWKAGLAQLAQETGLEITVCHILPGTTWSPGNGMSQSSNGLVGPVACLMPPGQGNRQRCRPVGGRRVATARLAGQEADGSGSQAVAWRASAIDGCRVLR